MLGLAPSDYDLLVASTSNDRLAALKSGTIAGTVLIQPLDFQAVDDGFRVLARSTDAVRDYQFSVLFTPESWARQNEATLVRVLRAYGNAARWLHEPANKEQAIQILAEATKSRPEYARQTYELYVEQVKAMTAGRLGEPARRAGGHRRPRGVRGVNAPAALPRPVRRRELPAEGAGALTPPGRRRAAGSSWRLEPGAGRAPRAPR